MRLGNFTIGFDRKGGGGAQLKAADKRMALRVIRRQESIVRKDIADWRNARLQATSADDPKQHALQALYDEVTLDAKVSSQLSLRIGRSQAAGWSVVGADGKRDDKAVRALADTGLYDALARLVVESLFYGCSLCELSMDGGAPTVELVPRKNVVPDNGRFYPDVYGSEYEEYRARPDFGRFVLEFYPEKHNLGLLNKAVPYVLMKKFAMSCWSELCEIYGIPPRVLKTNTTDPEMLSRAEGMMREVGAAAYFIIDTEEEFEFAQASTTNGDVYKNFIATCDEQISLLNVGAVLGQDTLNGNRSKEETSLELMEAVVESDKRKIQLHFNRTVMPALESLGIVGKGLRFEFEQATDKEKLWEMVSQASQYYEFDIEWLKDTFGMNITGAKSAGIAPELRGRDCDFFA